MKEGWTYKNFEDCLVKAAKAKQVQTSEYNSGSKYPIISQEDKMVSGYCDDDSLLYHIDNPVVIFGDHTRVLKYVDFDFVVGADGVKILIPKEFLKAKFLLYYLRWYQVPSLGYSRHYKLLKEIVLPVPPVAEQERIVAELDLLSGIIEKKKEQLKAYDQLAQSIFYTMFGDPIDNPKGWEVKKLGDCFIIGSGGTPSKAVPEYWEGGEIPWIG
ncbi:MAG: restriction endonuclease subunit S, partial [Bacteroidaceae bacterium]|nr:restriction endonuclease subunit S [Bacteroidaceae bacterium]